MQHYSKHVFVCTNQKENGKKCCAAAGGAEAFAHCKEKLVAAGLHGQGMIRVSKSGCLGRCADGPCIVIYPEGVWYNYSSLDDVERIIDNHLIGEEIVDDLVIDKES